MQPSTGQSATTSGDKTAGNVGSVSGRASGPRFSEFGESGGYVDVDRRRVGLGEEELRRHVVGRARGHLLHVDQPKVAQLAVASA
eukprot:3613723-Prymnesium_polylepis.4